MAAGIDNDCVSLKGFLFEPYWVFNEQTNDYEECLLNLRFIRKVEHYLGGKVLTTIFGDRFLVLSQRPI